MRTFRCWWTILRPVPGLSFPGGLGSCGVWSWTAPSAPETMGTMLLLIVAVLVGVAVTITTAHGDGSVPWAFVKGCLAFLLVVLIWRVLAWLL